MAELNETLSCGGTLKVTLNDWNITYYIAGPDRRYKGKIYTIRGSTIKDYITALEKNFAEYVRLKDMVISEDHFSKILDFGMHIFIAKNVELFNGLHLSSHKQPISTAYQLHTLMGVYESCSGKVERMQNLLRAM